VSVVLAFSSLRIIGKLSSLRIFYRFTNHDQYEPEPEVVQ